MHSAGACRPSITTWIGWSSPPRTRTRWLPCLPCCRAFRPDAVLLGAPEQASFSSAAMLERLEVDQTPITRAELGQIAEPRRRSRPQGGGHLLAWIDPASRMEFVPHAAARRAPISIRSRRWSSGETIGPVSVLLLAQSGYAPLAPAAVAAEPESQLVVISVDAADKDGLPSAETLEAAGGLLRRCARTSMDGSRSAPMAAICGSHPKGIPRRASESGPRPAWPAIRSWREA